MNNDDDTRSFPIQGDILPTHRKESSIPWWLAEIAYTAYVKSYGNSQTLERLAERGGFGRDELLMLLRK